MKNNLSSHIPTLLKIWRSSGKNGGQSKPLNPGELSKVSNALLQLQRGLTGNRNLAGAGYMQSDSLLGAYLLYYWPVTYTQIFFQIKEIIKNIDAEEFKNHAFTLLDCGCGPAPAAVSICDALIQNGITNIQVILADYSPKALELAKKIFSQDFPKIKVFTQTSDFQKNNFDSKSLLKSFNIDSVDFIVSSHALNELWKNQKAAIELRTSFVQKLCNLLTPSGILLLSEPSLLLTSRELIKIRDNLISSQQLKILAPCIESYNCPVLSAGDNHTCHAEFMWKAPEPVFSIARSAKLDRVSVKMTWFAFSKDSQNTSDPSPQLYRVVSDGMLNKSGRIRFLICDGKKRIPLSAKKDSIQAAVQGFFTLKRYDLIQLKDPEIRGDEQNPAFGINENTKLEIKTS